jgi:hypothetical protein
MGMRLFYVTVFEVFLWAAVWRDDECFCGVFGGGFGKSGCFGVVICWLLRGE